MSYCRKAWSGVGPLIARRRSTRWRRKSHRILCSHILTQRYLSESQATRHLMDLEPCSHTSCRQERSVRSRLHLGHCQSPKRTTVRSTKRHLESSGASRSSTPTSMVVRSRWSPTISRLQRFFIRRNIYRRWRQPDYNDTHFFWLAIVTASCIARLPTTAMLMACHVCRLTTQAHAPTTMPTSRHFMFRSSTCCPLPLTKFVKQHDRTRRWLLSSTRCSLVTFRIVRHTSRSSLGATSSRRIKAVCCGVLVLLCQPSCKLKCCESCMERIAELCEWRS